MNYAAVSGDEPTETFAYQFDDRHIGMKRERPPFIPDVTGAGES